MNVSGFIGLFLSLFEIITHHATGGIWFCCSQTEHYSPYRTPPNTMARTSVDFRPPEGDSPEIAIRGHLSPSKTREALGFRVGSPSPSSGPSSRFVSPRHSSASSGSQDAYLMRATIECWDECVRMYGYIYSKQGDDIRAIPITDGVAVPVEGRRIPDCTCPVSTDAALLIESAGLSLESFEEKRHKYDKTDFKKFLGRKNIKYVSYTDFQKGVIEDLRKNNVQVSIDSAKERSKQALFSCGGK